MPTLATTEQDNLRSRLPDPSQFFPELAGIAGGMFKVTLNGSIPRTTIGLVQVQGGRRGPLDPDEHLARARRPGRHLR